MTNGEACRQVSSFTDGLAEGGESPLVSFINETMTASCGVSAGSPFSVNFVYPSMGTCSDHPACLTKMTGWSPVFRLRMFRDRYNGAQVVGTVFSSVSRFQCRP